MPNMPVPYGDDVSAVDVGQGRLAVIKTDMLVGKTDVPPGMSLRQASRKAVVMNVSDMAAKGVRPIAILASIGVPRGFTEEDIRQIGKGLNDGARDYDAYVIGGDTNEACDLVISCTAFGVGHKRSIMKRGGAKPGDYVAVTGPFGKTSSGLKILLKGFSAPPEIRERLVDAVFTPQARLKEGLALAQTRAVTASIDSSDGLAWSLHEISLASNVGFQIEDAPIAGEVKEFAKMHNLDPVELSLYGGEEYELVVTIKPGLWRKAKRTMEDAGAPLKKIGVATGGKVLAFRVEGETIPIEARGWEHFKTSPTKPDAGGKLPHG